MTTSLQFAELSFCSKPLVKKLYLFLPRTACSEYGGVVRGVYHAVLLPPHVNGIHRSSSPFEQT